jgi:hypothetical protein
MKTFKQYINEKITVKEFFDKNSKASFNHLDDEEMVQKLINDTKCSRTTAIKQFKQLFGTGFKLNEDTEKQLQKEVVLELNIKLNLILKNSHKHQNEDFKTLFQNVGREILPIFNEEGFDIVNFEHPKMIIRSGVKDQGKEDFKIAADNVEFENCKLHIEWTKNEDGFLLKDLKVTQND